MTVFYYILGIAYQICLHTIDDLELIIYCMVGIRKGLHITMVCDGYSLVSPFHGTLYDVLDIRDTIHITHLGMAVKLHTLVRAVVHPDCGKV